MHLPNTVLSLALLTVPLTAQVIGIDDLNPSTGTTNTIPWGQTGGYTSLHVYDVATLRALGVCAGAVLTDVAVAPGSGTAGTYNAPQARIQVGHLAVDPPVAGAWTTHLAAPVLVHDVTSGPYTFPWSINTYASLPGFAAAGFVWDGIRDVGILMATSSGTTGTFSARRTATQLRHGVAVFNATSQAPTTNSLLAMEVRMTWTPGLNCATKTTYGTGCYDGKLTYYESFSGLPAFDFAGGPGAEQVIAALNIGTQGYLVFPGTTAWVAPTTPKVLNNAATPAQMTDDSYSQPLALPFSFAFPGGTTNVIHASANGFVLLGTTTSNSSDWTPTAPELIAQQPRLLALWCDLQPAINVPVNPASGVYYEVAPGGQTVYVTWLDVADRRGAVPAAGATHVNVQCALHSNGVYEYRYGTITPGTGTGVVFTGWSQGNAFGVSALDPGSIDLSATMPFTTSGPDRVPLKLDSNYPALGSAFTMTTTNVPPLVPLSFLFFGDAPLPGIDLGFIGAPDCRAYTNASILAATIPVTGTTATATIQVPVNPQLIGGSLTTQAVAFTLANPLNLATSNGLQWTIGN
jgi:hypothetical protein